MMKRIVFGVSLLLIAMLVVSCAPGEKTLSGQATSTSSVYLMKGDYFILSDLEGNAHLYQYKGSDKPIVTSPKVRIKNIETEEVLELNYVYNASLKGGALFPVWVNGPGVGKSKDYYLLYRTQKSDSALSVSLDPSGSKGLSFKAETLKIE